MSRQICCVLVAIIALSATLPAWAHHSPSAIFDMSKRTPLSGVLAKVDWINPHVVISIEVKNEAGKIEMWNFESNPPLWFRKVGVARNDIAKAMGQPVKVEINRAKDQSNLYGYLYKITFQNGASLELTNSGEYPR